MLRGILLKGLRTKSREEEPVAEASVLWALSIRSKKQQNNTQKQDQTGKNADQTKKPIKDRSRTDHEEQGWPWESCGAAEPVRSVAGGNQEAGERRMRVGGGRTGGTVATELVGGGGGACGWRRKVAEASEVATVATEPVGGVGGACGWRRKVAEASEVATVATEPVGDVGRACGWRRKVAVASSGSGEGGEDGGGAGRRQRRRWQGLSEIGEKAAGLGGGRAWRRGGVAVGAVVGWGWKRKKGAAAGGGGRGGAAVM